MKKLPTFLMESELYEQLSQIVANGSPMHIQITPCCGEIDVEIKSEVDDEIRCDLEETVAEWFLYYILAEIKSDIHLYFSHCETIEFVFSSFDNKLCARANCEIFLDEEYFEDHPLLTNWDSDCLLEIVTKHINTPASPKLNPCKEWALSFIAEKKEGESARISDFCIYNPIDGEEISLRKNILDEIQKDISIAIDAYFSKAIDHELSQNYCRIEVVNTVPESIEEHGYFDIFFATELKN